MRVNPFLNKPWYLRVCSTSLLKTLWKKQKLLVTSNFSFSHSVGYPFEELFPNFLKFRIVVCKLFQVSENLNFVVWKMVKLILRQNNAVLDLFYGGKYCPNGQCRSKIRLHILCSLILIYTVRCSYKSKDY